jgi:integrase
MGLTKRLWIKTSKGKRYDGSYYVEFRVKDDGKTLRLASSGGKLKRWRVGSLNKTVAKQQEAIIKTDLMKGIVESPQVKSISFKEWGEMYLNLEEVKRLRSYKDRIEIMRNQLIPFFGTSLLAEIKPVDVETYRGQRRKRDGSAPCLQTVNNDHIVFKHTLNVAIRRGLMVTNPASAVPLPNPHNERDRILSDDEWARLYEAAKPHLKPVLLLAYQLGQRFGEIVNLTWDRVDLQRGFITLRGIDTKTKKPRRIPLTPNVKVALQDLAKVRRLNTNHVFLYDGKPVMGIKRSFRTALEEAGIRDFRFHDLRHCAATNLRRAGVDTATAMQIVGHKSDKMWKRYNAIEESDLLNAAKKLNTYLEANTLLTPASSAGIATSLTV